MGEDFRYICVIIGNQKLILYCLHKAQSYIMFVLPSETSKIASAALKVNSWIINHIPIWHYFEVVHYTTVIHQYVSH